MKKECPNCKTELVLLPASVPAQYYCPNCNKTYLENDTLGSGKDAVIIPHLGEVETVNHPAHYGGKDNPYEAIKVIEAWELDFNLGNCLKYISRLGKKLDSDLSKNEKTLEDLKKADWYLRREIDRFQKEIEKKEKE